MNTKLMHLICIIVAQDIIKTFTVEEWEINRGAWLLSFRFFWDNSLEIPDSLVSVGGCLLQDNVLQHFGYQLSLAGENRCVLHR